MHRILDANWNRAAEGCRVAEDYVRFVLDDPGLAAGYKGLRHDLREALAPLDPSCWIRSRDVPGDVGTAIDTPAEGRRADAASVFQASQKRLEQALRCLEEYSKILSPATAQSLERLRYRAYDLGRRAGTLHWNLRELAERRLYVLTDGAVDLPAFAARCEQWFDAGADILQLRDKSLPDDALFQRARKLAEIAAARQKLAIINDRADLAAAAGASGVHLGQDDLPVEAARRIVGPHRLIGRSTHSLEQARRAVEQGADYLGYGPTFSSGTKAFAQDQLRGVAFVREVVAEVRLPGFAIGGITLPRVAEVLDTGVHGIAVAGAVGQAADPVGAIGRLRAVLDGRAAAGPVH